MASHDVQTTLRSPSGRDIVVPTGIFIDNQFRPAVNKGTFETINPATAKPLCTLALGTAADVDLAVEASRKAYKTVWGKKSTPSQRASLLFKWANLIEENAQVLAEIESLDGGKAVALARDFDVADSVGCLRYYAGLADKIEGKTIEQGEGVKFAFTRLEPLGVCGQIIPWNYPILMFAWKVAPALCAGNTIILKPAEQTPLSAMKVAELSVKAGFPPGVISIVNGYGPDVGHAIASHMKIDKVAFTGSTVTGRRVMEAAAKSNLKKCTLELGGKSPVIVCKSADIEQTLRWTAMGIFFNMGQDCTAGSRLYVHASIHDRFVSELVKVAQQHVVGDPFDSSTFQGPQISQTQMDKVLGYIEEGKRQGAKLELGGKRWNKGPEGLKEGYFVEPTIFSGCKKGMRIVDEEIFGPVLAIAKFDTEEEVIELANDTSYGLAAGIFSNDLQEAMRLSSAIEAGTVWINQYAMLSNAVPFGGFKQSGIGRELGVDAVKEYTQVKAVHVNYGEKLDWPLPAQ